MITLQGKKGKKKQNQKGSTGREINRLFRKILFTT